MVEKRSWIQLKYYQYKLNTGIYMLEPWERKIFSIFSLSNQIIWYTYEHKHFLKFQCLLISEI